MRPPNQYRLVLALIASLCCLLTVGLVIQGNVGCQLIQVYNLEDTPILALDPQSTLWQGFLHYIKTNSFLIKGDSEKDSLSLEDVRKIQEDLVPIFVITPTYKNPLQKVHLIRYSQLMKFSLRSQNLAMTKDGKIVDHTMFH